MDFSILISLETFGLGLLFAHLYYKKASKDTQQIIDKMPDIMTSILKDDLRKKFKVSDLFELVSEKQEELAKEKLRNPDSEGPFPYNICPDCGSTKISQGPYYDINKEIIGLGCGCSDCGFADFYILDEPFKGTPSKN